MPGTNTPTREDAAFVCCELVCSSLCMVGYVPTDPSDAGDLLSPIKDITHPGCTVVTRTAEGDTQDTQGQQDASSPFSQATDQADAAVKGKPGHSAHGGTDAHTITHAVLAHVVSLPSHACCQSASSRMCLPPHARRHWYRHRAVVCLAAYCCTGHAGRLCVCVCDTENGAPGDPPATSEPTPLPTRPPLPTHTTPATAPEPSRRSLDNNTPPYPPLPVTSPRGRPPAGIPRAAAAVGAGGVNGQPSAGGGAAGIRSPRPFGGSVDGGGYHTPAAGVKRMSVPSSVSGFQHQRAMSLTRALKVCGTDTHTQAHTHIHLVLAILAALNLGPDNAAGHLSLRDLTLVPWVCMCVDMARHVRCMYDHR